MAMATRYRRLCEISRLFPCVFSGGHYKQSSSAFHLLLSSFPPFDVLNMINREIEGSLCHLHRYSTVPQALNDSVGELDLLSFIKSSFEKLEGPNHRWLGSKGFPERDRTSLVLIGLLFENSSAHCNSVIIEKLKSIHQRFPNLFIVGFQFSSAASSPAYQTHLAQLMIQEYITFPMLLASKSFTKISNGHHYVLIRDYGKPEFYHEENLTFEIIDKAMRELSKPNDEKEKLFDTSTWAAVKNNNISKEPFICSLMQNILISSPVCLSADETGHRLFLSDSSHHRIIVSSEDGEILDCIGSSPGFEDGNFDSAKFMCPSSSFYCDVEDCLYIVDSENHAIRKADMETRVVETIYPKGHRNKKSNAFWGWITNMLGFGRNVATDSETSHTSILTFPWHLIQSLDDRLYIISRSFETLWILDLASGEINQTIKGFREILDLCEESITDKVSLLKQMPPDWLNKQIPANFPVEGMQYASLLSSFTTLGKDMIICDAAGHRLVKLCRETGVVSNLKLSNFGVLGLPYWLTCPLERVYAVNSTNGNQGSSTVCNKRFMLLPGRVDIQLNVDLPADTELVEPLKDSSIWRQARGPATVVSGSEGGVGSTEKVGVAQQWYDELDNLAFENAEIETVVADEDENNTTKISISDRKVRISCAVNTSPGTSEVIISAALYLKLKADSDLREDNREIYARRLADLLAPEESGQAARNLCYQILLNSSSDLRDLVFTKPLHIRIRLDSRDHPKADTSKAIILTDSSIEVDVSL